MIGFLILHIVISVIFFNFQFFREFYANSMSILRQYYVNSAPILRHNFAIIAPVLLAFNLQLFIFLRYQNFFHSLRFTDKRRTD